MALPDTGVISSRRGDIVCLVILFVAHVILESVYIGYFIYVIEIWTHATEAGVLKQL